MKHSFTAILCGLCVGLLTAACSSDELTESSTSGVLPQSELKLVKVPVSISTASNSATRGMKKNDSGYAVYDFDSMNSKQYGLLLCLKLKEAKTVDNTTYNAGQVVYTSNLTPTITTNSDGTVGFTLTDAEVEMLSGTSLSDYDVCALLNTGLDESTFKSAFIPGTGKTSTTFDLSSLAYLSADSCTASNMAVPMYSSYDNSDVSTDGSSITLDFHLMGTVITVKGTNPLADAIRVNSIELRKCNVQTGEATFTFGQEDSNGNPSLSFTSTSDGTCTFTPNGTVDVNPTFAGTTSTASSTYKATTSNTSMNASFWCMPTSSATGFKTHYTVNYSLVAGDGSGYGEDEITFYKNTADTTAVTLSDGFEGGNSYLLNVDLPKSDLMITEFEQRASTGWNYSMVEVYNPTNEVKDLQEYGLARQFYLNNKTYPSYPATYVGFNASAGVTDIADARLQDLYIAENNATNVKNAKGIVESTEFTNSYATYSEYDNTAYNSTSNYTMTVNGTDYTWSDLKPYQLAPGQSVVLFAGGMMVEFNREKPNTVELPSGSDMYNADYLKRAIAAGECKYAIAVDNGSSKNDYSKTATGTPGGAGTLQFGHAHNVILMKKASDGYNMLDAGLSLDPTKNQDYSDWCYNYPFSTNNSFASSPRYMVRIPAAMYPMTLRTGNDNYLTVTSTMTAGDFTGTDQNYYAFDWQWSNTSQYFHIDNYPVSPGTKYKKGVYLSTSN